MDADDADVAAAVVVVTDAPDARRSAVAKFAEFNETGGELSQHH